MSRAGLRDTEEADEDDVTGGARCPGYGSATIGPPVVETISTWIGAEDELLAVLHTPTDHFVQGGVVLCPSLGKQQTRVHAVLRRLAHTLAQQHLAVLRFDYSGTGDSAGQDCGSDQVPEWLASIQTAVRYLRGQGVQSIALAGYGIGGLLAANAVRLTPGIDRLLVWDPPRSGRAYLRRETSLYKLTVADLPTPPNDALDLVDAVGISFNPLTARTLNALKLNLGAAAQAIASGTGVGLPTHDNEDAADRPRNRKTDPGRPARVAILPAPWRITDQDVLDIAGDPRVMMLRPDVPDNERGLDVDRFHVQLPTAAMKAAAGWLSDLAPTWARLEVPAPPVTLHFVSGGQVREEIVRIQPGMVGIRAAPAIGEDLTKPPVLLLSPFVEDRTGPGRLWVRVARDLAELGVTSLRFDRRGVGDSVDDGQEFDPAIFTQDSVDDVLSAARTLSPEDPASSQVVGFCAAAWQAASAGLTVNFRHLVLMGYVQRVMSPRNRHIRQAGADPSGERPDFLSHYAQVAKDLLSDRSPQWLWKLMSSFREWGAPLPMLRELVRQPRSITLILAGSDATIYRREGALSAITRWDRDRSIRVVAYGYAHHALVDRVGRDAIGRGLVQILSSPPPVPSRAGFSTRSRASRAVSGHATRRSG